MTVDADRRSLLGGGVVGLAALGLGAGAGRTATLAPRVTKADFKAAVAAFRNIVGPEWVFADTESLRLYRKSSTPDPGGLHAPIGAVCPSTVEEVQAILKVANRYRQPVWPIYAGGAMGYGQATAATPGQMILDLKRMNRILAVDAELCTALLEPGVTYRQLYEYLRDHHIPLWIDIPNPGPLAGPVGDTLERSVAYAPFGDPQCGMEVVLPNSEILRTGMGSTRNPSAWQASKWGYGPYLDGIFTQSNFGVVTKMGLWLLPEPPVFNAFVARFKTMADAARIVDIVRSLRIANIIQNPVLMTSAAYQVAMFSRRSDVWDKIEPVPDEAIGAFAEKVGLGLWNTYFSLDAGSDAIAVNELIARTAFQGIGGEVLTYAEMGANAHFRRHAGLMHGRLTLEESGLVRWKGGGGGLAWFTAVGPAKGSETAGQIALAKAILAKYNLDYISAFVVGPRELRHNIALAYDKTDPDDEKRADACYRELVTRFGDKGWAGDGAGVHAMDLVAAQYGDTNRSINATIKNALDPNHILAPGKFGIA